MTGNSTPLRRDILICFLLVAMTVLVFGQTLHHQFINFDDETYITENWRVQQGLTKQTVVWAFTTTYANFWHPLTWLSLMADCHFFGLKAGMHHATSLWIHILSTLLLFLLLRKSTGAPWRSAVVAALFAIHPLHVESVAWASERKDILSTFFWMLTMWSYQKYADRPALKSYLLTLFFFILGLMAKPMLVTLPFVLLLWDYWPLKRFRSDNSALPKTSVRNLILEKIPFLFLALAAGIIAYIAQKTGGALGSLERYPVDVRIANALVSYVSYIGKMLWPLHLAIPYPHPGHIPFWKAAGALALLVAISVFVVRKTSKYRYLATGWWWYVGTLLPVIGLIQVGYHAMADRFTYVSLTGLFIVIAWGLKDLGSKWFFKYKRTVFVSFGIAVFLSLIIAAWIQTRYWKNSITLFTHSLALNTQNLAAHNDLGSALLGKGDLRGGEAHFLQAMKIDPGNPITHHNLGFSLYRQGKTNEAIALYQKALKLNPRQVQTHEKLANALKKRGNLEVAAAHYREVLKLQPHNLLARNELADILMRQGKIPEAITQYSELLRLKPDYLAYYNLGSALLESGKVDEAIPYLTKSLLLRPDNALAHNNLANALARRGSPDEALLHYHEAIRINPDLENAHCNMGIILKKQGKLEEALEQFSETLRINPKSKKALQKLMSLQKNKSALNL